MFALIYISLFFREHNNLEPLFKSQLNVNSPTWVNDWWTFGQFSK